MGLIRVRTFVCFLLASPSMVAILAHIFGVVRGVLVGTAAADADRLDHLDLDFALLLVLLLFFLVWLGVLDFYDGVLYLTA